jgi:hypothetical protein
MNYEEFLKQSGRPAGFCKPFLDYDAYSNLSEEERKLYAEYREKNLRVSNLAVFEINKQQIMTLLLYPLLDKKGNWQLFWSHPTVPLEQHSYWTDINDLKKILADPLTSHYLVSSEEDVDKLNWSNLDKEKHDGTTSRFNSAQTLPQKPIVLADISWWRLERCGRDYNRYKKLGL